MPDILIGNVRGPKGETGPANTLLASVYQFCASDTGATIPQDGAWTSGVPQIEKGKYIWCRNILTWDSGPETILYSVGYVGYDGEFNGIELVDQLGNRVQALEDRVTPISKGGTESSTLEGARAKLGITALQDSIEKLKSTATVSANGLMSAADKKLLDQGAPYLLGVAPDAFVIAEGADLDTITVPGTYSCRTPAVGNTLKNSPVSTAFKLMVDNTNAYNAAVLRQVIVEYWSGTEYVRTSTNGGVSWDNWRQTYRYSTVRPYAGGGTNANSLDGAKSNLGVTALENKFNALAYGNFGIVSSEFQIQAGADLNKIVKPGSYGCQNTSIATSLSHCPLTESFKLDVEYTNRISSSTIRQTIYGYWTTPTIYTRFSSNGGTSWSDWVRLYSYNAAMPVEGGGTGATTIEGAQVNLGIATLLNQKVARADYSEITLSKSWLAYPQFTWKQSDGTQFNLLITATGLRMRTMAEDGLWTDVWQINGTSTASLVDNPVEIMRTPNPKEELED